MFKGRLVKSGQQCVNYIYMPMYIILTASVSIRYCRVIMDDVNISEYHDVR